MKIAIPLDESRAFSPHYGASSAFASCEIDPATRQPGPLGLLLPTQGSPCSWPAWLRAEGITTLLVGGMGSGARATCAQLGINVIPGITPAPIPQIAADYAAGRIQPGENTCADGHGHDHHHEHGHVCCHHHA